MIRANRAARRVLLLPDNCRTVPVVTQLASFPDLCSLVTDAAAKGCIVVTDPQQRTWQVTKTPVGTGLMVTLHDISTYLRNDEHLRGYKDRWEALERAGVAMVYKNHETGMVHFSNGCKQMLGYADEELDTWLTVDEWHAMLHPDELEQILATFQADGKEQVTFTHVVHRLRCKDGSYKWIHALGSVVRRDTNGRPLRGAGVLTDLTCLREACRVSGVLLDRHEVTTGASLDIWTMQEAALHLTTPGGITLRLNAKEFLFFSMLADT